MERLLEKQVQAILVADLENRTTPDGEKIRCYVYGKRDGFVPIGHQKRFDILIFHSRTYLPSPIAVELKPSLAGFSEITKALHDQIPTKYIGQRFSCKKENWEGIPPIFGFTTKDAVFSGVVYTNNYPEASNFFVNRFAWRFDVAVLYKIDDKYWLSHQNKLICLEDTRIEYHIWQPPIGENRKW